MMLNIIQIKKGLLYINFNLSLYKINQFFNYA